MRPQPARSPKIRRHWKGLPRPNGSHNRSGIHPSAKHGTRRSVTKIWAGCVFAMLAVSMLADTARADELSADAAAAFDLSTLTAGLELPTAIEFLPDGRLVITEKM